MAEYRVLDLFCGLGGFSSAFEDSERWEVWTVDIEDRFDPDITADVFNLRPSSFTESTLRPSEFDVVLASPPCTLMSTSGNHEEWDMNAKEPTGDRAREHVALTYHTVGLIRGLSPRYWFLENPRHGRMTWILGQPEGTVTYCQYGRDYMKPTALWGDHPKMAYRSCQHGDRCHTSNVSDDGTSAVAPMDSDHAERSKVPYDLSESIRNACESGLDGNGDEQIPLSDF